MVDWQSFAGSAALEKSMHSSRFDFSSLQTQHGYEYQHVSLPCEYAHVSWVARRRDGRTLGFSEVAGAGGCAIGAEAGMAGCVTVSDCRARLSS